MKSGYAVQFNDMVEIRMGSPFNVGSVKISGGYSPELPAMAYQDLSLLTEDKHVIFLVRWISANEPQFVVQKIDDRSKTSIDSQPIPGCCQGLTFSNGLLNATVWRQTGLSQVTITFKDNA